jgi:multidrug efflux pump subunit AcrA (membrane-fusion protein)
MRFASYSADNALVVPVSAVQRTGEGDMVFVADGRAARAVPVQTGHSSDGLVEILSGLKPGDRVVTAGYEDLDTGTPIAVQ